MKTTTLFLSLRLSAANSPITLVSRASMLSVGASIAIFFAIVAATADTPAACAQAVTFTGSGAVNFGSANVCPSGKTAPAPCSKTLTLTYNVTASGTLGTPQALTTGAPNLDYTVASGTTCTGSVTQGNTCEVNIAFAPLAPGSRNGAVEIVDSSGNVLATNYIYGTGTGPALAFSPGASIQLGSGLSATGLAVDASGNLFVADTFNSEVKEILAAGGYTTINILGSGFDLPFGVAVDGAGNVFVADTDNNAVKEILAAGGYSTINTLASGFINPTDVAVDGSGNVFVADYGNSAVKEVLAAGGYLTVDSLGSGFNSPYGLAVDGSGNVYLGDEFDAAVKEITAASGYTTVKILGSGFGAPAGVAVDASGNVYVADVATGAISEILAVGGYTTVTALSNSFNEPVGIAVDGSGNVYIGDGQFDNAIAELPRTQPPSFAFGSTIVGATSSPLSTTVQNIGNANLVGTSLAVSANWDQVAGGGTPQDCAYSFSLVPGAECNLSISFEPTEAGDLTGAATLTDNALNGTDATQSIPLSGDGIGSVPPEITSLNTNYAAPYSVIFLYGNNFGATKGSNFVTFNGIAAPIYYFTSTFIATTVPGNATSGNVVVTAGGQASNAIPFTVLPMPRLTGISPASGPVGTVVTISGENLLDYQNKGTVTFNGRPLPIVSQSSTALTVAIPTGAATGDFHVLVNDTGMNSPGFTVTH